MRLSNIALIFIQVSVFSFYTSKSKSSQNGCNGPICELELSVQPLIEHLVLLLDGQINVHSLFLTLQLLSLGADYGQVLQNEVFSVEQNDKKGHGFFVLVAKLCVFKLNEIVILVSTSL